jgi:hypothetical protein
MMNCKEEREKMNNNNCTETVKTQFDIKHNNYSI